jgi:ornithine decarboxylase
VTGLSFHLGSQCIDAGDFDIALSTMRAITDEASMNGFTLKLIDIGGGFAAAYGDQSLPPTKDYCDEVYRSVRRHFGDTSLKIIAEPGRILCAESVTLVTCVIGKTHRQGKPWYIIDDGIYGSFSGRRFSESDFKWLHSHGQDANVYSSVIAGPTCDSGDIVSHEQWLPDLAIGDILMVPSMGAYTSASAAAFNGMPLARTVMID